MYQGGSTVFFRNFSLPHIHNQHFQVVTEFTDFLSECLLNWEGVLYLTTSGLFYNITPDYGIAFGKIMKRHLLTD